MSGSYFSAIFGKSPVRPLQEHMEKILSCVSELAPFTKAVLAGKQEAIAKHHKNIVTMENEADELKKELRLRLPSTLFMPIDRRDVLEVLTMQDMADKITESSHRHHYCHCICKQQLLLPLLCTSIVTTIYLNNIPHT